LGIFQVLRADGPKIRGVEGDTVGGV